MFTPYRRDALKKGGREATLSFQLGAVFEDQGGAMLWAENTSNGQKFADIVSLNANHSRYLDFGNWKFWVVAWAGNATGDKLTGLTRCDFKNVTLNANSSDGPIFFNLENSKC